MSPIGLLIPHRKHLLELGCFSVMLPACASRIMASIYRLRVGDWRVIYEIENDGLIILVLRVASRGEVYR